MKIQIKEMSKKKKILLAIGLAALIAIIVLLVRSCGAQDSEGEYEDEASMMMTATAERMDIYKRETSTGEIKSALEEKKTPHAQYVLEKINVQQGQEVKEGSAILTYTNGQIMEAPYDCVVLEWDLPDLKQKITNDHYVKIAGSHVLMMELSVSENKILEVKKGNPATIKVNATGKKYKGVVSYISDIGEYSDGDSSFTVRVNFDNDGDLKLGMNGKASITLAKAENVIAVPVDAVIENEGTSYVTLQKSDDPADVEEVEVKTGISDDNNIEIKSGLKEGDVVQYVSSEEEDWEDEEYMDY